MRGPVVAEMGMWISRSKGCFSKSAVTAAVWAATGVRGPRAFLRGRRERGSAEVGMDSGMGSDIVGGLWCGWLKR